jgi:hypothetical protein
MPLSLRNANWRNGSRVREISVRISASPNRESGLPRKFLDHASACRRLDPAHHVPWLETSTTFRKEALLH